MKALTHARLLEVVHYDPETGTFTNACSRKKVRVGQSAGCVTGGRLVITIDYRKYDAGPLAWFYMKGEWPDDQVDHEDRNPLNNRWLNLRPATNKQNQENRSIDARNKSGVKGVHWHLLRSKWCAQIRHNGSTLHLGLYVDLADATHVRRAAERLLFTHGENENRPR